MITPSWAETLDRLHRADSVGELWAVLVAWHGIRSTAQWDEPYALFRRFHEDDRDDAVITAALLCTDHRWRRAAHRLIDQLASSEFLNQTDLDELADWFLKEELLVSVASDANRAAEVDVARTVWPPLRRWAARHTVQRTSARWRRLMDLARSFPSADCAAIAAGVMDAAGHLTRTDAEAAVAIGVDWGSDVVRLAALRAFADLHGLDAAREVAASDRSAKVRAWADDHPDASPHSEQTTITVPGVRNDSTGDQATLF